MQLLVKTCLVPKVASFNENTHTHSHRIQTNPYETNPFWRRCSFTYFEPTHCSFLFPFQISLINWSILISRLLFISAQLWGFLVELKFTRLLVLIPALLSFQSLVWSSDPSPTNHLSRGAPDCICIHITISICCNITICIFILCCLNWQKWQTNRWNIYFIYIKGRPSTYPPSSIRIILQGNNQDNQDNNPWTAPSKKSLVPGIGGWLWIIWFHLRSNCICR